MLTKKNRLRKTKEFEAVFKNSKTFKEGFLVLKTTKNNLDISRFGFIVSQKISKKATIRNRIKRRLREIIRLEIKNYQFFQGPPYLQIGKRNGANDNNKKGADVALIALSGIDKKNFLETKEDLIRLLKKAGIV